MTIMLCSVGSVGKIVVLIGEKIFFGEIYYGLYSGSMGLDLK